MLRPIAPTLVSLLLLCSAIPVAGQTPVKPATPPAAEKPAAAAAKPATPSSTPARALPPDREAYTAAGKIADPDEKIAALEKFIKDFPESTSVYSAYMSIFDTLVKNRPTERARILGAAKGAIEAASDTMKASIGSRIATQLVSEDLFIDDAARFAETALEKFEEAEKARVVRARATHLATIGRIRVKQGRLDAAERALEDAYAANPETYAAVVGRAELAEARNDPQALDYWMTASLTGRLTKKEREHFEGLYRKAHGSLDALEAALDARYLATHENPVHPEPYRPTPERSNRVVLAEVFTGAGCPPCVAADLAFDAALERYSRKDLALVMYHLHIPAPDPLTNKATVERAKFYGVNGVPTWAIEGVTASGGGARADTKRVYDRIIPSIDKAMEVAADADLQIAASLVGNAVKVRAVPAALASDGEPVTLHILLVEEMLSYSGQNGVRFHPMVVRSLAGEQYGGFPVDRSAPAAVDHVFDLARITGETGEYLDKFEKTRAKTSPGFAFSRKPVEMTAENLSVVAFLQEQKSRKILQAASIRLLPSTTTTTSR